VVCTAKAARDVGCAPVLQREVLGGEHGGAVAVRAAVLSVR